MTRNFIIVFFITCFCHPVFAQGDFISLGIGPSMIYGDNSGSYREFKFKVQPAVAFTFNKQINEFFAMRGTVGAQMFDSGEYDVNRLKTITKWGNQDQAYGFKGTGYFLDVLPTLTTNPNELGMLMSSLQFYLGAGFGVMFSAREQKTLKNGVVQGGILVEGDVVVSNETNVIPYIPIKTGLSTNLSGDWDFALEFVLYTTLSSELDGNNIKDKIIHPDMTGQILFVVKRYIGKSW